jgi:hypothetical protein
MLGNELGGAEHPSNNCVSFCGHDDLIDKMMASPDNEATDIAKNQNIQTCNQSTMVSEDARKNSAITTTLWILLGQASL